MAEQYLHVPAAGLRRNDRIIEYTHLSKIPVGDGLYSETHIKMAGCNLTVTHAKWVDAPFGMYRCIQVTVVYQDGEEEFLYLRARSPVWVMRNAPQHDGRAATL